MLPKTNSVPPSPLCPERSRLVPRPGARSGLLPPRAGRLGGQTIGDHQVLETSHVIRAVIRKFI